MTTEQDDTGMTNEEFERRIEASIPVEVEYPNTGSLATFIGVSVNRGGATGEVTVATMTQVAVAMRKTGELETTG